MDRGAFPPVFALNVAQIAPHPSLLSYVPLAVNAAALVAN
jgi:hypothetical protein